MNHLLIGLEIGYLILGANYSEFHELSKLKEFNLLLIDTSSSHFRLNQVLQNINSRRKNLLDGIERQNFAIIDK
jgi:hypothetical protein